MRTMLHLLGIVTLEPVIALLDMYEPAARLQSVLKQAMTGYVAGSAKVFAALAAEMDNIEAHADKIKRRIRNHLPPAWRMPVDMTLYLDCTHNQDDILDYAQEALRWLSLRQLSLSAPQFEILARLTRAAAETVAALKPALQLCVDHVGGRTGDRQPAKDACRAVRQRHAAVTELKYEFLAALLGAEVDFRDLLQAKNVADYLHRMSHSAEGCAGNLRAMLAK